MSNELAVDPAISLYFKVTIDGKDIGAFISCDGLALDVETEERVEGGNNSFVWKLPVRIKYSNVKLTRPIGPDSKLLAEWIAGMSGHFDRFTASISATTPQNDVLCTWELTGVIPVKWQGPSFGAESGKVAQETLELAHHGFTYKDANKWT